MDKPQVVYYDGTKSIHYQNDLTKVGGHRNWRNNNPGNIKYTTWTSNHGAVGSDGTFAIFNNMDDGYKAQEDLLQSGNYENLSLNDAIYRWAPPSENDSAGYVDYVSSHTGIDSSKKMKDMTPEEMDKIVRSMSDREGMQAGKVIEGATINGNNATGGKQVDDSFGDPGTNPGGGSGSGSGSTDSCVPGNLAGDATAVSNKLAMIEGSGSYTQKNTETGASGRYQFMHSTAIDTIKNANLASSTSEAEALWLRCGTSDSVECQKVQDTMSAQYSKELTSSLKKKEIEPTTRNLYLAWNQGSGGASVILNAAENNADVDCSAHPTVCKNMHGQAWQYANNGKQFIENMDKYIKRQGVDPDSGT